MDSYKKQSLAERNNTNCTGESPLILEQTFEDAPCESLRENIAYYNVLNIPCKLNLALETQNSKCYGLII